MRMTVFCWRPSTYGGTHLPWMNFTLDGWCQTGTVHTGISYQSTQQSLCWGKFAAEVNWWFRIAWADQDHPPFHSLTLKMTTNTADRRGKVSGVQVICYTWVRCFAAKILKLPGWLVKDLYLERVINSIRPILNENTAPLEEFIHFFPCSEWF